jgi:DNA-directed RNA polymerase specialized sigma subunit, sigma24 homolog
MDRIKAFEADFRTYYRPLCLYALHYLGDPDVVEDVVQESFTALWRQEKPVANVKAWLYLAVRNRSIDALRRTGRPNPCPVTRTAPLPMTRRRIVPRWRPACGQPWTPCPKCAANVS